MSTHQNAQFYFTYVLALTDSPVSFKWFVKPVLKTCCGHFPRVLQGSLHFIIYLVFTMVKFMTTVITKFKKKSQLFELFLCQYLSEYTFKKVSFMLKNITSCPSETSYFYQFPPPQLIIPYPTSLICSLERTHSTNMDNDSSSIILDSSEYSN